MRLIKRLDRNRRVTAVPYQKPGVPASFGLIEEECRTASWAIAPGGRRHRGAAAVNLAISVALGTRLPYFLYALPGVRPAEDFVYGWVARHRYLFPSDTPYCKQHPEECR
ncbi:MAG: thiol-disulfide oxidoreductase DCC family protein [Rubrobacteraceae bacterium]